MTLILLAMREDGACDTTVSFPGEGLGVTNEMDARLAALTDLLMAHIIVMNRVAPGTGAGTVEMAEAMSRAAEQFGKLQEARELTRLLDQLRVAMDLPANE